MGIKGVFSPASRFWSLALVVSTMIALAVGYGVGKGGGARILAVFGEPATKRLSPGANIRGKEEAAIKIVKGGEPSWTDGTKGWQVQPTALHQLEIARITLPPSEGAGGAIAASGDHLLILRRTGTLSRLDVDGRLTEFPVRVPMGLDALKRSSTFSGRRFLPEFVRSIDLMLLPTAGGSRLFVTHHVFLNECIELRISAIELDDDLAPVGEFRKVFSAAPCVTAIPEAKNENRSWFGELAGGRLLEFAPGKALLTVGDFGMNGVVGEIKPENSDFGRLLLVDLDTGESSVFAEGFRSSQGLIQSDDGRIWLTDHGPQGGDELNLVAKGGDFGWPYVTLGLGYGDRPWPHNPGQGRHAGYQAPVHAWVPSIGISNLVEAPAAQFPLWRGDLLITSLRERTIFRMRLEGDRALYIEPLRLGERMRDIAVLSDGKIAIYTDSNSILVLRNAQLPVGADWSSTAKTTAQADWAVRTEIAGAKGLYEEKCASCHALWRRAGGIGPHLVDILNRPTAMVEDYAYSNALRTSDGAWTPDRLRAYIQDPNTIPGTRMPKLWLTEIELDYIMEAIATAGEPQERRH